MLNGLSGRPAARPRPLEIIAAEPAGHIHNLAEEIEPRLTTRRHRARTKGSGWYDYKWPNPLTDKIEDKTSYVERMGDYWVGVGVYRY